MGNTQRYLSLSKCHDVNGRDLSNAPLTYERIWLQADIGDGATWCQHRQEDEDVPYVREDFYEDLTRQLAEAQAERDALRAERDRFCDCLMAVSGILELPHADDGPCDDPRQYERELNGLCDMYRQTEAERVRHSTARFKAEAELAALKAAMVKPLEWRQLRDYRYCAEVIGVTIEVYRKCSTWVWEYDNGPSAPYETCDEAKAAAQEHYTARILSALNIQQEEKEMK